MKIVDCDPRDILIGTHDVQDHFRVEHYFDKFMKGGIESVEPSFVVRPSSQGRKEFAKELKSYSNNPELLEIFSDTSSCDQFYGVERLHRAVASTLAFNNVRILEIKTKRDLDEANDLEDFSRGGGSVARLVWDFEGYIYSSCDGTGSSAWEFADYIAEGEDFPQIIKNWTKVKGKGHGF